MKEITKYVAEDGTMFDDYEECRDYEERVIVDKLFPALKFFDSNGKELDLHKKNLVSMYEACISYIKVIDPSRLSIFHDYLEREGYDFRVEDEGRSIFKGDILEFDGSEWCNFSERIRREDSLLQKIKESN